MNAALPRSTIALLATAWVVGCSGGGGGGANGGNVYAIAVSAGSVQIGGTFLTAANRPLSGFARLAP
jgi:hypothetical protein